MGCALSTVPLALSRPTEPGPAFTEIAPGRSTNSQYLPRILLRIANMLPQQPRVRVPSPHRHHTQPHHPLLLTATSERDTSFVGHYTHNGVSKHPFSPGPLAHIAVFLPIRSTFCFIFNTRPLTMGLSKTVGPCKTKHGPFFSFRASFNSSSAHFQPICRWSAHRQGSEHLCFRLKCNPQNKEDRCT